jgi:hypothetical protein
MIRLVAPDACQVRVVGIPGATTAGLAVKPVSVGGMPTITVMAALFDGSKVLVAVML